jgi:hypothetical protein
MLAPTILLIFFCDLSAPQIIVPPWMMQVFLAAFTGITSNAIGSTGILLRFLNLLLPFIFDHVIHVLNHAITCSVFPTMW